MVGVACPGWVRAPTQLRLRPWTGSDLFCLPGLCSNRKCVSSARGWSCVCHWLPRTACRRVSPSSLPSSPPAGRRAAASSHAWAGTRASLPVPRQPPGQWPWGQPACGCGSAQPVQIGRPVERQVWGLGGHTQRARTTPPRAWWASQRPAPSSGARPILPSYLVVPSMARLTSTRQPAGCLAGLPRDRTATKRQP